MHLSFLEDEGSRQGNDEIYIRFDADFLTNNTEAEDNSAQDLCPDCSLAPTKHLRSSIPPTCTDPIFPGLRPAFKGLNLTRKEKKLCSRVQIT